MGTPRESADRLRPKLKALSTLSLGFYNGRSHSSTSVLSQPKSFEPAREFEPAAEENVRVNADPWHHIDGLKVAMMNIRPDQTIPMQYNYSVNILLEHLQTVLREQKEKEQQVEEAKAETSATKQNSAEKEESWNKLEAQYKQEIKNLELIVAGGKRGLELVALSRSNTELRKHRAEFRKTTSNLSTVKESEKADEDNSTHRTSNSAAVSNSNRQSQVFNHKRTTSKAPSDKLFADFGTLEDTQLSQSIQHHDDALAGAAKDRWLAARMLEGLAPYSIASDSGNEKGAGLGLTLYDPPLAPLDSFKPPLPPPIIIDPGHGHKYEYEDDEGADNGEELAKLPGGGYMLKPQKRTAGSRAGSRAKAFFGIGKKKAPKVIEPQERYSDTSSSSSSDSDDASFRSVASALASVNHLATIASPVPWAETERSKSPMNNDHLELPRATFRRAKKTSHRNLAAFAQSFIQGTKKDGGRKSDESERTQTSAGSDIEYEKPRPHPYANSFTESLASSEEFQSSMNVPALSSQHGGRENTPLGLPDQPSRSSSLEVPSVRQRVSRASAAGAPKRFHGSVKKRGRPDNLASRSTSSLRYVYTVGREVDEGNKMFIAKRTPPPPPPPPMDHFEEDGGNGPINGKSNSVGGSFEEDKTVIIASSTPRNAGQLGLGIISDANRVGERDQQLEHPHLPPYAHNGLTPRALGSNAPERVYDARLMGNSSATPLDVRIDQIEGKDSQTYPAPHQKASVNPIKTKDEEAAEAEVASRRTLWRASGRKFDDDELARLKASQRPENFRESVIRRQTTTSRQSLQDRNSLMSVVTVLRHPRESLQAGERFALASRDESLIRGRSVRSLASNGQVGSSRREAGPGRSGEKKTESRMSTRVPRGSIRGNEDFMASVRNAMVHPSAVLPGWTGGRLPLRGVKKCLGGAGKAAPLEKRSRRDSETGHEGDTASPSDDSALLVRKPGESIRGNEASTGSGSEHRPLRAGFVRKDSTSPSSDESPAPFKFATARDSLQLRPLRAGSVRKDSTSPSSDESPAPFKFATARDSLQLPRMQTLTRNDGKAYGRPSSPFAPGDWRRRLALIEQENKGPTHTFATPHESNIQRREVLGHSGVSPFSRVVNAALAGSRENVEHTQAPKVPGLQAELNMLRRGGSGNYGRGSSRGPSGESVSSIRKRLEERQASVEMKRAGETHKAAKGPVDYVPMAGRVISNTSRASGTGLGEGAQQQRSLLPGFEGKAEAHRGGGSGQPGTGENTWVPSGSKSTGHTGQRQTSGEQAAPTTVSRAQLRALGAAMTAARKAAEDEAAKERLAEQNDDERRSKDGFMTLARVQ